MDDTEKVESEFEIEESIISDDTDSRNNSKLKNEKTEDDSGSVLVLILKRETKISDPNIDNLKWIFSDPYFTVQTCSVELPLVTEKSITADLDYDVYIDNYMIRKLLTYAAEGPYVNNFGDDLEPQYWWVNFPVIIIRDSSICNITPDGMKIRVKTALEKASDADLYFLCKWSDKCDKYSNIDNVDSIDNGSTLKKSIHPTSTQAIMYNKKTRDHIREDLLTTKISLSNMLNSYIGQGELYATVFVPNIIDFDIRLSTKNDDYAKLNECAPPTEIYSTTSSNNDIYNVLWFVILIILVIVVGFIAMWG